MGTSAVADVDAPPVFEPAEHVLDFVALTIERGIVLDLTFRFFFDGMQAVMSRPASASRGPVGVVASIAEQPLRLGNSPSRAGCANVIADC